MKARGLAIRQILHATRACDHDDTMVYLRPFQHNGIGDCVSDADSELAVNWHGRWRLLRCHPGHNGLVSVRACACQQKPHQRWPRPLPHIVSYCHPLLQRIFYAPHATVLHCAPPYRPIRVPSDLLYVNL
jgi:hypothetical protein